MEKPDGSHDVCFDEVSPRWDEGIPLGNGLCGAMIWGDGHPLRWSLDRLDLWDTRAAPESQAEGFEYAELIKLVRNQDHEAVRERFEEFYGTRSTPTKLLAGRLELDYGRAADTLESRLSLRRATAQITLGFGRSRSVIRTFLHATDGYGRVSIRGDARLPEVRLSGPGFLQALAGDRESSGLCRRPGAELGYPPAERGEDGAVTWLRQQTCEDLEWAVVVAREERDGGLDLVYVIAANTDGDDWLEAAKEKARRAAACAFEQGACGHERWWAGFWSASALDLPDKVYEAQWYLANYLFACASRAGGPAFPLQGVWTEDASDILPPWHGDYHHDLNTQMAYWHYMKANHLEEGRVFVDFLWALRDAGRAFAKRFFDAPGICLPSVMSIQGQPLGGWVMYCTNLINQAWLCQAFDHYWRYSGDDAFLADRAYPYLRESAACLLRWLEPGPDGKLLLPLSSSPEIHDSAPEAWLAPNSNNDLAILMYLFKTLSEMAARLGNGEEQRWDELLRQLPEFALTDDHVLMLSRDERLTESHRHLSHAMAVYPLELLDYDGSERDRKIIDATVRDLELLGTGLWMGFSFPWMSLLYSKQGNGEGAAYQLKLFWENFCSRNGLHLNGDFRKRGVSADHYRPFTLEANMAAACALQEMLLATPGGAIRVFGAVPDAWKKAGVAFENLRAQGGVLVSARMSERRLHSITLTAIRQRCVRVENRFSEERLAATSGEHAREIACPIGETFVLSMATDETVTITPVTGGITAQPDSERTSCAAQEQDGNSNGGVERDRRRDR